MALTGPRWIAAAAALCAISAALLLRTPRPRPASADSARRALVMAERGARSATLQAARLLRVLQLRDSLRGAMGSGASAGPSRIVVDRGLPAWLATVLRDIAGRAGEYRPAESRTPTDIVFLHDTLQLLGGIAQRSGLLNMDYLLPDDVSDRCVVLVRAHPRSHRFVLESRWLTASVRENIARSLLGPCGYYEWFGAPGTTVAAWLERGGWEFALSSAWQHSVPAWEGPSWWRPGLVAPSGWPLRGYISPEGFRCVTGDVRVCRAQALRETAAELRRTPMVISGRIVSGVSLSGNNSSEALGPRTPAFIAAVARSVGPERFQAFWTSPLPPAQAFEQSVGQDIGSWTADWTRRMYGRYGRGPGIEAGAMLLATALAGAALVLAHALRVRRQVV